MSCSPQFKSGNLCVLNERISLQEFRGVDPKSIIGLYISETMLFLGILLILFNNFGIVEPGTHFGDGNITTIGVFFIGVFLNFFSIPYLYISSFKNFKKEHSFWDKETFWILPIFFFGTFFLKNSSIPIALPMLFLSIGIIILVHSIFTLKSVKNMKIEARGQLSNHGQYVMTMKYLSAYYLISLLLLFSINPLSQAFYLISLH